LEKKSGTETMKKEAGNEQMNNYKKVKNYVKPKKNDEQVVSFYERQRTTHALFSRQRPTFTSYQFECVFYPVIGPQRAVNVVARAGLHFNAPPFSTVHPHAVQRAPQQALGAIPRVLVCTYQGG